MITMDVFVRVCLALLIHGCCSQKITFNSPIHYDGPCGVSDGQCNWTTTGTVQLTKAEQIFFAPKLQINTCSPTCSLDLTECFSDEGIPDTPDRCYCQKQANGLLKVHIGAQADPAQIGLTVQASIPSCHKFRLITASSVIGTIPTFPEQRPPVKPTYQVDGGVLQPFLPVQTVKVCPNVFVTINICVEDKAPGSLLQVSLGRKKMSIDLNCLNETQKFNFESTSVHEMTFSYKESISCTHSKVSTLFIQENEIECQTTTQLATSERTTISKVTQKPSIETITKSTTPHSTTTTPHTTTTTPQTTTTTPQTTTTTPQTTTTTPQTTTTTPQVPDCPSPDLVKYLSPGMTQLCDSIDGGKWTTIQRHTSNRVNFHRKWVDYEIGFGEQPYNYWLGLKAIHHLCYPNACQLRFDLEYKGKQYFAKYDNFTVEGADTNYKMFVSGYHGNAGDNGKATVNGNGFMYHSGMSFSTRDRDNDKWSAKCGKWYKGGWWYNGYSCHAVNINGNWGAKYPLGMNWGALTGYHDSVTVSEMKVRQFKHN